MRPRFSLRVILIATATVSILLYLFVVRPTILANRFVMAANAQDMDAVDAFLADKNWREEEYNSLTRDAAARTDHIYATLFPRDWSDWFGCRRRIVLRIARHFDRNEQHAEWTEDVDFVSRATGISVWPPDYQF